MTGEEKKDGPTADCLSKLLNGASAEEERVKVGSPVQDVSCHQPQEGQAFKDVLGGKNKNTICPYQFFVQSYHRSLQYNTTLRIMLFLCL